MSDETYRYLDEIFIIMKPEFEKYIIDVYLPELHLDKAKFLILEHYFHHTVLTFWKELSLVYRTYDPVFNLNLNEEYGGSSV